MKKTRRKGFNFYRSYYDVFNKLPTDKDKLEFISILLDKQFLDVDPVNCSMIVEFAYESQLHSITKQVKGWKDATSLEITDPQSTPRGVSLPKPTTGTPKEEKEEEEEKGKVYNYTLEREILNSVANLFDKKYFDTKDKKQKWLDEIRKLIQIDGENEKTIIEVIKFARTDDFWSSNLLSINSLRKKNQAGITKFDQIKAKIPNLSTTPNKKIGDYVELTEKEKEAQHVNITWTYIHYENTYKKVHSDDKGNYIEKGRERIYL